MALPTKEDISLAIERPGAIKATELEGYSPVSGIIGPESYSGGFCIVFPFVKGRDKKAVRIWHQEIDNIQERYKLLSKDTKHCHIKSLIGIEYVETGLTVDASDIDLTLMEWIEGKPLKDYISSIFASNRSDTDKKRDIKSLADELEGVFKKMHAKGFSHGDLQHENIIITNNGDPRFIDYDCFYTPSMGTSFVQTTSGYNGYQHPSRFTRQYVSNEKADYFSELILVLSIRAIANDFSLWEITEDLDYALILTPEDFKNLQVSSTCQKIRAAGDVKCNQLLDILADYLKKDSIDELEEVESVIREKQIEAEQKEQSAWREACRRDTIGQYEAYLKEFPDGPHADEARNCITRLRDDNRWAASCRKNTLEAYRLYQTDWPEGRHISECRQIIDELIWYAALNENTIESYENYIRNSTTGKYVGKARKKIRRLKWIKRAIKWFLAFAFFILAACTVNEYKEFFVQLKDTIISHLNIVPPPKEGGEKGEDNTTKGGIITIPKNNESNQERIKEICEDLDRRLKVLEEAKPYLDFTKGEDFNPHAKEKVEELIRQLNRLDHAKAAKFQLRYDNLYKK